MHHPVQQLIRQVSVDKAGVCAGESITIDVLAKDPAAPGAPVAVSIDGVPVSTYTEVESWYARTRFSSLGRAVPGLSLVTSAHSSVLGVNDARAVQGNAIRSRSEGKRPARACGGGTGVTTGKCRCGSVELPLLPTRANTSPGSTDCPGLPAPARRTRDPRGSPFNDPIVRMRPIIGRSLPALHVSGAAGGDARL